MRWLFALLAPTLLAAGSLAPRAIVSLGLDRATIAALATDPSGNFYVAGAANNQVLVVKVSPSGNIIYSKVFGGTTYDAPSAIAVDPTGAAYIIGYTHSPDFPIVNGYLTSGSSFLTKLSPDGATIVYSTYLTSDQLGTARAVAVDPSGSAYVTGSVQSSGLITTPGAFMTTVPPYQQNVFVVKMAPDGSKPVWATYLAGNGIACSTLPGVACPLANSGFRFNNGEQDAGSAIVVDLSGNVYIAGWTNSAGFPVTPGVVQPQYADPFGIESQGFVTKLSPDGSSLIYSTYLGNAQGQSLTALAVDSQGNAIVGGGPLQIPLTPKPGWPSSPLPQFPGGFIAKLDPQAVSLLYATNLGQGFINGLALDAAGNAYATANYATPSFPVTSDGVTITDVSNAFVELGPGGAILYATELPWAGPVAVGTGSAALLTGTALTILTPADPSQPAAFALQNAADHSLSGQAAPGEIILLTGANLGSTPAVTFDGVPAPVLPAPPLVPARLNQVMIQVPFEIAGRQRTTMQIDGSSQALSLAVTPADPAIFETPGYGVTTPLNSDGTVNGPNNPAQLGSFMTIFVTGAGAFSGGLGTGDIAPLAPLFSPQLPVSVQVFSGVYAAPLHQATVLYAGSAPTQSDGILQINFLLPVSPELDLNPGAWVTVQVGTSRSLQTLIAVKN
jgi:uncharacterized protein (TIGR03437 family)